jgi:hypothetical protein
MPIPRTFFMVFTRSRRWGKRWGPWRLFATRHDEAHARETARELTWTAAQGGNDNQGKMIPFDRRTKT